MRRGDGCATIACAVLALFAMGPATPMIEAPAQVYQAAAPRLAPHVPRRLFVSGHSLTNHPFPEYLEGIAADLGRPLEWNMQGLVGSSVKDRSMGNGPAPWTGYAAGIDKAGHPLDVRAELQRPGPSYDTLIITEQHTVLGSIVWNDSLRLLRDFHDRVIALDPQARTYLFAAWMNVLDLDDPARWIAYERAAAPIWRCMAERINHDLAAAGRPDRLTTIPAASALATLVEEATSSRPIPGLEGADAKSILAAIFRDDVHLRPAGVYYVALVTTAILHGRPVDVTVRPRGMRQDTAERLRQIATTFVADYARGERPLTVEACRGYVSEDFVPTYLAYQRDLQWRDHGSAMTWLKWAKLRLLWPRLFRRHDATNPFYVGEPAPL